MGWHRKVIIHTRIDPLFSPCRLRLFSRASFAKHRADLLREEIQGKRLSILLFFVRDASANACVGTSGLRKSDSRHAFSLRSPYPPEQVPQLVTLHVAQPDLPVEDRTPGVLPLDAMAKSDMRRSGLESLHRGQETELASLLDKHSSSNSAPHCMQRNSYIGIEIHRRSFPSFSIPHLLFQTGSIKTKAPALERANLGFSSYKVNMERATGLEPATFSLGS
jgi:hypothetical protein